MRGPRRAAIVTVALVALVALVAPMVAFARGAHGEPGAGAGASSGQQATNAPAGEVIDRMLAVVAGDLIMMSDVAAAVEFGLVPQTAGPDLVGLVLAQLIDRSLMLDEVARYAPPEPSAEAVDRELAAVRDRFLTAEAFQSALVRYGVEESSLRQTLRANLRLRAYLAQRFSAVPPSDEELAQYFNANPQRFARDGAPPGFEAVRRDVLQALELDRRQAMVNEWLTGLRRRAVVTNLYQAGASQAPR